MRPFVAATLAGVLVLGACSHNDERVAVQQYLTAIRPIVKEGGGVVQQGIKPGIADLENAKVTPAEFRSTAAAWRNQMQGVRQRLSAVPAPGRLRGVSLLFDSALAGYLKAIDAFVVASGQPSLAKIKEAITRSVPIAEEADRVYDNAVAALKAEQKRAGVTEEAP